MKRRARFQFHLSTAIVLMFVAAGLLWLNLQTREAPPHGHTFVAEEPLPPGVCLWTHLSMGWPCSAWSFQRIYRLDTGTDAVERGMADAEQSFWVDFRKYWLHATFWSVTGVAVNLAVALAILAAVAFVCEWRIRRKTARAQAQGS